MPITQHETALYGTLSQDGDLISELGGTAIYNKRAPQSPPSKYVIFQWQGGGYENESPHETVNVVYAIFGIAATQAEAAAIDDKIRAALHGQTLSVTGWTNFWCMREDHISFVEEDSGGVAKYRAGAIYRIRSDKNG